MSTDTAPLKRSAQNFRIFFDLGAPRSWEVMDVDENGVDQAAPTADPDVPVPLVEAFDAISSVGTITGSIDRGGFSCELNVPKVEATFPDFHRADLRIFTWHGGTPGVVGAAGIDPDDILLFRGYMQSVEASRPDYGKYETTFSIESSSAFLRDPDQGALANGFDFAADTPHGDPVDAHAVARHLVIDHTNLMPRSDFGIYFLQHALTRYTINAGNLFQNLKGLADNFSAGEGWCFFRRADDLYLGSHPNLVPDLHPTVNNPIIDLDDWLLVPPLSASEVLPARARATQVIAQLSDGTEYASPIYSAGSNQGGLVKRRIRTDDTGLADQLAQRLWVHLNRRFRSVKVETGLMVAVDLGDCITLTGDLPQRGHYWSQKKFVVTEISWKPDIQRGRFASTLTLDEVVTP